MDYAVVATSVAAVLSTGGLIAIRPFLRRHGMIDKPGEGRSHTRETLRGAGVAMIVSMLVTSFIGFWIPGYATPYAPLLLFIVVSAAYAVIDFLDDMSAFDRFGERGSALIRLAAIGIFSVLASYAAWRFTYTQWWIALLAIPALIFYVNAVNFMDGVNGITGMHGLGIGLYFAATAYLIKDQPLLIASLAMATAFACFLPWNIPHARLFCGDSAAYGLGAGIWALAIWSIASGASAWAAILPTFIYTADVSVTLLRRILRGESLTARHREHIFTQFSDKTSHVTSSVLVTMATAICSVCGLLITLRANYTGLALAITAATVAWYLLLPLLVRRQTAAVDEP